MNEAKEVQMNFNVIASSVLHSVESLVTHLDRKNGSPYEPQVACSISSTTKLFQNSPGSNPKGWFPFSRWKRHRQSVWNRKQSRFSRFTRFWGRFSKSPQIPAPNKASDTLYSHRYFASKELGRSPPSKQRQNTPPNTINPFVNTLYSGTWENFQPYKHNRSTYAIDQFLEGEEDTSGALLYYLKHFESQFNLTSI